mmetsp:Transcript_20118/g.50689  ORF Transcript_20118/g.50689 Transcript_20118/m.50689 type:complete len:653 (-) Transcript_20118:97-2055(-)
MGIPGLKEVAPARPAGAKPSASPAWARDGDLGVPTTLDDGVTDLGKCWRNSVKKFADSPCLGKREGTGPYTFETYAQIGKKVDAMGAALTGRGVQPKSAVGVYGANCPQWMVAMQACNRQNLMCVPLYDTLGVTAVEFILKHSDAASVFVEGAKLATLASALPSVKDQLKLVVYWGEATSEAQEAVKALGIDLASFDELLEAGTNNPVPHVECDPEDLCTIMYTSGTTGDPKGVMIRHKSVLAEMSCLQRYLVSVGVHQDQNDVFLSYLPLAHIFDRVAEEFYLSVGGTIGYWRGDMKGLTDDIAALKPTLFVGVPRVFERIHGAVMGKIKKAGWLPSALFHWAMRHKRHYLDKGFPQHKASPLFDSLVFSKIKAALGGRCRVIISGGAPLSPHVEQFLQVAMCALVCQGYGLTETMAGACVSLPDSPGGNVGPPLPGVQLRLESSPELNYDALSHPPRGEVLIRGDIITAGYYKLEDTTREVLEPGGWFHTGDIGEIADEGVLKIIDRKKNIFKLSQGEYIAVEKVEAAFGKCDMVEQIWVYGNSYHSALVCVVVPAEGPLKHWAKENGASGDVAELCGDEAAKKAVLDALVKTGRSSGLKGFEIVKAVHLEPEAFDVERNLITPTFKLKRPQLLKRYQAEVDAMYAKINA